MSARVPLDNKLELDEVEGLVAPSSTRKQTSKSESSASGNRWACFLLTVGIVLGVLMTSDSESVRFWEGKGGENVDNVREKEPVVTLAPTLSPVPQPTPPPTDAAVTPPPTVAATPPPSPPPTIAAITPPPTLLPTGAAATPPPSDADAAVTPPPTLEITTKAVDLPTNPPADGNSAEVGGSAKLVAADDYGAARYPKPSLVVKPDPLLTSERAETLAKEWGKWEFVDNKADQRPKDDFSAAFPFGDVPRDKFPANAWQTDPEYLKDFLDQGIKLVDRSMEAILSEYGHGKKDAPDKSFDVRMQEMFEIKILDPGEKPRGKGLIPEAGWTTTTSFQGLVRRVLHAIMTNDTFTLIVGGHSAAAGHGNLFKQAYGMQFHKIMEPIFALLGVKAVSRNLAQGGLGTLQSALGFKDIYGDSIDFMVWDSGMTEGRDAASLDMYWRQALISGDRVPFLLGAGDANGLIAFNTRADADIANHGEGKAGLLVCDDEAQCDKFPWAARYMQCSAERGSLCKDHKWGSNCWVDRPDVTPLEKQQAHPGSQVGWHPGFRSHQLTGRILNMFVLKALKEGLAKWQQIDKYALPDDAWHVTAHYENIRKKLGEMEGTPCFTQTNWPARMCTLPMRAHTEFTPRANPEKTSITSIIKPGINGYVPHVVEPMLYTGPDVHNPLTTVPEGEIDVLAIISNGRQFDDASKRVRRLGADDIITGLGLQMGNNAKNGYCDGTYNAECSRNGNCLLLGHQDSRGCVLFNSYSGWIVMNIPAVEAGLIVAKIETWHWPGDNLLTKGWTSINNLGRRSLRGADDPQSNVTEVYHGEFGQQERMLKLPVPEYCDNFKFDFAIDRKVTTWDKATFQANSKNPQRVVETQILLDDPNFTKGPKDVELAIRMRGCGDSTQKTFCLSHVYFA